MKVFRFDAALAVMLSVVSFFVAASTVAAGDESVKARRETVRLTAKLLIEQLTKNIEAAAVDASALRADMKAAPEDHRSRRRSKKLLRERLKKRFRDHYRREVERVVERLDSETPEGVESWFSAEEIEGFMTPPEAAVKKNLDNQFLKVYKVARGELCRLQFAALAAELYPQPGAVDAADPAKLKTIVGAKLEETKGDQVLFEEVAEALSRSFVAALVADALEQKRAQMAIVEKHRSENVLLPSMIADQINAEIERWRKTLAKRTRPFGAPAKVYPVFPSVRREITRRAAALGTDSFVDAVKTMKFDVDEERIRRLIVSDYAAHRVIDASLKRCCQTYSEPIIRHAIGVAAKPLTKKKRAEAADFLTNLALTNDDCQGALRRMVMRSLRKPFDAVRKEIRDDQLREYFKPLADGSWEPEVVKIERLHRVAGDVHVDDPLAENGIANFPLTPEILLDETRALISEQVDFYVNEGRRALVAQLKITDDVERSVARELPGRLKSKLPRDDGFFRRVLAFVNLDEAGTNVKSSDLDAVVKLFTDEVKARWDRQRVILLWKDVDNLPANRDTKYAALFPMVRREIEKRAKAMLHGERAHDAPAGENGEGGVGKAAPPLPPPATIPRVVDVDMIIDVDLAEDRLALSFLRGEKPPVTKIVPLGADGVGSMGLNVMLADFAADWLREQDQREENVRCSIFVRVFNDNVPYGVVANLRDVFKKRLESIKSDSVTVQWFEKFYSSNFKKGTRTVPESYRSKGLQFSLSPGMELME